MNKKNTIYLLAGAALLYLLFRKNNSIGRLFEGQGIPYKGKKFRYQAKGQKGFRTITADEIMDTDYWPNETDNNGTTISEFVFNGDVLDKWKNNIETITRIK